MSAAQTIMIDQTAEKLKIRKSRRADGSRKPKTMSHFAHLANLSNSLRSTGPRTEEGKAASRMNAVTHGFRSTHVTEDENSAAVVEARRRWIDDLGPEGEIQEKLADLSFRQSRQLERVLAADDAAVAVRVGNVRRRAESSHKRFLKRAIKVWRENPTEGVPMLRAVGDGVSYLIDEIDRWSIDLHARRWTAEHEERLAALGMEGDGGPDVESLRMAALVAEFLAPGQPAHTPADAPVDHRFAPMFAELLDHVGKRLAAARRALLEDRVAAVTDEAKFLRASVDAAKFDTSHAAGLRRRYASDIQRDMFKSLREFRELVKISRSGAKPRPAALAPLRTAAAAYEVGPEEPAAAPGPFAGVDFTIRDGLDGVGLGLGEDLGSIREAVAKLRRFAAPNEATSGREDRPDRAARPAPPDRRDPRRRR